MEHVNKLKVKESLIELGTRKLTKHTGKNYYRQGEQNILQEMKMIRVEYVTLFWKHMYSLWYKHSIFIEPLSCDDEERELMVHVLCLVAVAGGKTIENADNLKNVTQQRENAI